MLYIVEHKRLPNEYGDYYATSDGRIWSVRSKKYLAILINNNGYEYVFLYTKSGRKKCYIHRLVLMAFIGFPTEGKVACHGDGNNTNNWIDNLRWDTQSANMAERWRHYYERR